MNADLGVQHTTHGFRGFVYTASTTLITVEALLVIVAAQMIAPFLAVKAWYAEDKVDMLGLVVIGLVFTHILPTVISFAISYDEIAKINSEKKDLPSLRFFGIISVWMIAQWGWFIFVTTWLRENHIDKVNWVAKMAVHGWWIPPLVFLVVGMIALVSWKPEPPNRPISG